MLKGISWRIIATADTLLVVFLITCATSDCSFENALKIGLIEFFVKLIGYYIHERFWERFNNLERTSSKHSLYKTISWRFIATSLTFLITGAILAAYDEVALFIALTEFITKFVLYFIHERLWLKIPLGKIRNFFK